MPHYAKSEEWLRESQLLLEARPTTTRITTKYAIKVPKVRKPKTGADNDDTPTTPAAKPARGSLTLKTYDPISGVTLKYKTTKAAEVSRLILCLGKLSRPMAGLPELKEEIMADAPEEGTPRGGEERGGGDCRGACGAAANTSGWRRWWKGKEEEGQEIEARTKNK
ncbi:hypothetical protein PG989_001565 [Apiospora arundinis]